MANLGSYLCTAVGPPAHVLTLQPGTGENGAPNVLQFPPNIIQVGPNPPVLGTVYRVRRTPQGNNTYFLVAHVNPGAGGGGGGAAAGHRAVGIGGGW